MMQVITVKSRFIADNQTDMDIEIKQKGTPDIVTGAPAEMESRCAVRLKPRERSACLLTCLCPGILAMPLDLVQLSAQPDLRHCQS